VLELSSFQLYDLGRIRRSPHVAVITNITPNHIDWHGDFDAYIEAKANIAKHQTADDHLWLWKGQELLRRFAESSQAQMHFYPDGDLSDLRLNVPGEHNRINASAALGVGVSLGLPRSDALEALAEFKSLPHRLELVAEVNGVQYYNDSIATTPESAIAALDSFDQPKVLIAGGYDKGAPIEELCRQLAKKAKAVICIGKTGDKLVEGIQKVRSTKNGLMIERTESLENAVTTSAALSEAGDVVLLSPGFASYDMFTNFEHRGQCFRQAVARLK
jgi:UDP-N-acetylmuramoylalanine--D-glutamate ligase